MNHNNSSSSGSQTILINEPLLVPVSELPFHYNNSVISTLEEKEKKGKKKNMVRTRQQKRENTSLDNKNQYSIEQWFSPNSKRKINQELKSASDNQSNSVITIIDLTEGSGSDQELNENNFQEEFPEEIIKVSEFHAIEEEEEEENKKTPKKRAFSLKLAKANGMKEEKKNETLVKSPYFTRGKKVADPDQQKSQKMKPLFQKKVINLVDSSSGEDEPDSEDTIQESEPDLKPKSSRVSGESDLESEHDNDTMNKTDNEEDLNQILMIDEEIEEESEEEEEKKETFYPSPPNSHESEEKKMTKKDEMSMEDDHSSLTHELNNVKQITDGINDSLNTTSIITPNNTDTNENDTTDNNEEDTEDSSNDEQSNLNSDLQGKVEAKNPIPLNQDTQNQKKEEYIKKLNGLKEKMVVLINSNKENTLHQRSVNNNNSIPEVDLSDSSNTMEEELEEENHHQIQSNSNKKRRRLSLSEEEAEDRKKIKFDLEDVNNLMTDPEEKKITYKQSSLTGFSKLSTSPVPSFKPRKKSSTSSKTKTVLSIPTFPKLSSRSVANRYRNLVMPDIIKLLSVADFLEKFEDCIIELHEKINFYTLYQAILYPSLPSFKIVSNVYVALLKYLHKEDASSLIIPINEYTWQYYLIPTLTQTLRVHYGLKWQTINSYSLPPHLEEMQTHEFYDITPLAHVRTLQQLISVIADTPQFREDIEQMLDHMVQLGLRRRYENVQKKMMEEEINDKHREVNIVGIRIKTLELERKKEKEENSNANSKKSKSKNAKGFDHRALSRLHAEYNKKVSALDKLKRAFKKKEEEIQKRKKEKLDIKNKILKGNERFLGIDRFNRYYWLIDIKYTPQKLETDDDSDDESKKEKEKKKPNSILSFITKDEKGKLALSNQNTPSDNIYGIVIEDCKRKEESSDNYYNVYYYYDDNQLYHYTYEFISSTSEVKDLLNALQLEDYDEELLHSNIVDLFNSRGYKIKSQQKKLGSSSTDLKVETSLQNFRHWCDNLGQSLLESVTETDINFLDEKNIVMYLNKINEMTFALEKDFELPPITIILDDMANPDTDHDIKINNILRYRQNQLREITDKIKEIYTNHSDSIPHENVRKPSKQQNKSLEQAILSNNDVKLIVKKDQKEYVKFSDHQLDKITYSQNLSDLYSWFYEIKKILEVKREKITGKKPSPPRLTSPNRSHNLRERKKTNYTEIYYASDEDFM